MTDQFIQANGNEAVALAAISAGIGYFAHYPGSPVNFVEPALRKYASLYHHKVIFNDALNEHIAALAAGGASFAGARSMVVLKHVGLNIAADPLTYLAYTGVKGGMVIVAGTDPGANASTGEQDVHWYARMFNIPLFEPVTVKEIYRLIPEAYSFSEKYHIPVMVFIPVRLAYDAEMIPFTCSESFQSKKYNFEKNKSNYINIGIRNITNHRNLLKKIKTISEEEDYYKSFGNPGAESVIITRGLTFTQVFETLHESALFSSFQLFNIDLVYPVPAKKLEEWLKDKKELLIIEDQDGFLEEEIKMNLFNNLNCKVYGKEFFPAYGEIDRTFITNFFRKREHLPEISSSRQDVASMVPERLGTFCEGCPHRPIFFVLDKILKEIDGVIGGDIGCSSLPPFRADWLMCMNAGIGISQGISHLGTPQVVFSTGGDGSFFHAGMISLQSAVKNKIDLIHLVLDNKTVAMTGHQDSPSSANRFNSRKLMKSHGVDRFYRVNALHAGRLEKILRKEIYRTGVRLIWVDGKCIRLKNKWRSFKIKILEPEIHSRKCGECRICYDEFACPAITTSTPGQFLKIDLNHCVRCGACRNICPHHAIRASFKIPMQYLERQT